MAVPLRPHGGQHGAGHLRGSEEIDLHLLAQLVGQEFLGRAERAASGDVGEHVDAAEARERGLNRLQARIRVGHVEADRERRLTVFSGERVERVRPPSRNDGAVAALQHGLGQRAAEAARCAGDEPDPIHCV